MADLIRRDDGSNIDEPHIDRKTGAATAGKKGRAVGSLAIIILMTTG